MKFGRKRKLAEMNYEYYVDKFKEYYTQMKKAEEDFHAIADQYEDIQTRINIIKDKHNSYIGDLKNIVGVKPEAMRRHNEIRNKMVQLQKKHQQYFQKLHELRRESDTYKAKYNYFFKK